MAEVRETENLSQQGSVCWESPSNIALIKYWGKEKGQIPKNPSVSFTLEKSKTTMNLFWEKKGSEGIGKESGLSLQFLFEGKENPKFGQRIEKFLKSIQDDFPFLKNYFLRIESENTFPHSAGIASSASSLSALALCLVEMEKAIGANSGKGDSLDGFEADFYKKASYYSRLGSGSACRSVYGGTVLWGHIGGRGNEGDILGDRRYACPLQDIHPVFESYCDSIIVVDPNPKPISSTAGHGLMEDHPFRNIRYSEARKNLSLLLQYMKEGDLKGFGEIVEKEALSLHALMMTSTTPYFLLRPKTLEIIEKLKSFRNETELPVYFTLDAGPNLHLLYPEEVKGEVQKFIKEQVLAINPQMGWIEDQVGMGPKNLGNKQGP